MVNQNDSRVVRGKRIVGTISHQVLLACPIRFPKQAEAGVWCDSYPLDDRPKSNKNLTPASKGLDDAPYAGFERFLSVRAGRRPGRIYGRKPNSADSKINAESPYPAARRQSRCEAAQPNVAQIRDDRRWRGLLPP